MGAALDVVQKGFAAFGRRDIPALLKLVADEVDWKEVVPASLPYSGLRRNPAEVAEFLLLSIEPMIPRSSSRENSSRSAE